MVRQNDHFPKKEREANVNKRDEIKDEYLGYRIDNFGNLKPEAIVNYNNLTKGN